MSDSSIPPPSTRRRKAFPLANHRTPEELEIDGIVRFLVDEEQEGVIVVDEAGRWDLSGLARRERHALYALAAGIENGEIDVSEHVGSDAPVAPGDGSGA